MIRLKIGQKVYSSAIVAQFTNAYMYNRAKNVKLYLT